MSDMIERCAKVFDPDVFADRPGHNQGECYLCDANRDAARRTARAVIEAMRDATPKMLRAASAAMSPGKRPTPNHVSERAKHGIRYRAMIDAALEEQPAAKE